MVGVSEIDLIMMITASQQSFFANGTFQIRNLRKILVNLDVCRTFQTYRKVVSPMIAKCRQYHRYIHISPPKSKKRRKSAGRIGRVNGLWIVDFDGWMR